jgi:1,2-phenylacetyl-CoA epoxidase PaaB subunit
MTKARQKAPPNPKHWEVFHLGRAGKRLGIVEAADADEALRKAIEEFGIKPRYVPRTLVRQTT